MFKSITVLTAAAALIGSQAVAADAAPAQIVSTKGSVLVSQDGKLTPAVAAKTLRSGDRVVAKDGQVSIKYADGCQVTLKPNAMATIGKASPCSGAGGLVQATQGNSAQIPGLSWFGTAVVGVAVIAVIAVVASNDDDPASP